MTRKDLGKQAVRTIEIPDKYPAQQIARSFAQPDPELHYIIAQAAALEQRYEQITKEIRAGGPGILDKGFALAEVETQLVGRYAIIGSRIPIQGTLEEQVETWRLQTDLLAKKNARSSGMQL